MRMLSLPTSGGQSLAFAFVVSAVAFVYPVCDGRLALSIL